MESKSDRGRPWAALLRLWVVLAFSFVTLKLLIELIYPGYIDLRSVVLLQFALIPAGQALVYWIVARRTPRG